jgi:hypothetical protein
MPSHALTATPPPKVCQVNKQRRNGAAANEQRHNSRQSAGALSRDRDGIHAHEMGAHQPQNGESPHMRAFCLQLSARGGSSRALDTFALQHLDQRRPIDSEQTSGLLLVPASARECLLNQLVLERLDSRTQVNPGVR